jgi:hypothetical protein
MGIDKVSLPSPVSLPQIGTRKVLAGVVAAVAASVAPSAFAEIELGEGISVSGFIDMSYLSVNEDGEPAEDFFGVDQIETDFMYAGSNGISAQVDIEYGGTATTSETFVEQAFVTKKINDQFSLKAGRFLSYSGWETEEPTGLFQYSGAGYAGLFYGGYQQGVSAHYDGEMFDVMGSVVTSAFNGFQQDAGALGYELGVGFTPVEGLTAKAFYIVNNYEGTSAKDELINAWISYSMSGFTFAAEYNTAEYANGAEADGYLLMGNYASGPWGITVRYHDFGVDGAGDVDGFTLSPSYKAGDNLLLVAEFRTDDFGGPDTSTIALEALFTF